MNSFSAQGMPTHQELVMPVVQAITKLGGSANSREIIEEVIAHYPDADHLLTMTYENRPNLPVLEDRISWSLATTKRIGATEQPSKGMYMLTDLGREAYRERRKKRQLQMNKQLDHSNSDAAEIDNDSDAEEAEDSTPHWEEQLLTRLHELIPDGFEKFVIYLLKRYDLKLTHVGGSGDEGIDAIGTAPLSHVLSTRVAVQVKRYSPDGKPIGRDTVALFQRDAATKGAERAILVTLSRFTEPARKAHCSKTDRRSH